MAIIFEVVDLRSEVSMASAMVEGAVSPEDAARKILGMDVFRSGRRQDLVARVYWQGTGGPKNMVRLYAKRLMS